MNSIKKPAPANIWPSKGFEKGTYVNLENFSLADHGLSMQDMRAPGNQTLSPTKHREEGYFLSGDGIGGKFRLFKR